MIERHYAFLLGLNGKDFAFTHDTSGESSFCIRTVSVSICVGFITLYSVDIIDFLISASL